MMNSKKMKEEIIELRTQIQIQRSTIRQLETKIEKDKQVELAMSKYFDTLYGELIRITDEKDRELEKDKFIDRIMETVYDNIHIAFDSIVKDKTRELVGMKDVLGNYDSYMKEVVHNRTRELSEENQRLQEIAMTDDLTGLTNRRGFLILSQNKFNDAVERNQTVTLFFMDLDRFKSINDTYGHNEGDWLLKKVAWILHRSFRGDDIICRYGGDEFAVFIESADINSVLQRIETFLNEFNNCREKAYALSLSIGWETLKAEKGVEIEDVLKKADEKMYERKAVKKNDL